MMKARSLPWFLGLLAVNLSGCLPLTLASAGLQAYQYNETGEIFGIKTRDDQYSSPGSKATSTASTSNASTPPTATNTATPRTASNASIRNLAPYQPRPDQVE